MLPLYGVATAARGFDPAEPRQVLRLRSPKEGPAQSADVALVRHAHEFEAAASAGFVAAMLIGDGADALPHGNALPRMVQVPSKFDYLGDGAISWGFIRSADDSGRSIVARPGIILSW
jgi:hypothetical protein